MARRTLSLFLLAIFLFNVVGYYGIFWLARERSNAAIAYRIDSDQYTSAETITIKFPLTLPYPSNSKDYERVHGSFEHQGEFYKLVKQKLEEDTLYIVCIRDHQEKKLVNAMADYTRAANDIPANSKTLKLVGGFAKDFESTHSIEINNLFIGTAIVHGEYNSSELLTGKFTVPSPPPWRFC
jgi:hypothetical protein